MFVRPLLGGLLTLLVVCSEARPAWAGCALPEPEIVWSAPRLDGGVVPVDGVMWLVPSGGWVRRVSIDGVDVDAPLSAIEPISLAGLEPGTHEVRVELALSPRFDAPVEIVGEIVIEGDATPLGAISGDPWGEHLPAGWSGACWSALNAWDCYDTGGDFLAFHVETTRPPIAWEVAFTPENPRAGTRRVLLPAECGRPQVFGPELRHEGCVQVTPLYPEGRGESSAPLCAFREGELDENRDAVSERGGGAKPQAEGEGCASSGRSTPTSPVACWGLAVALLWRQRSAETHSLG